ncbi:MAG: hypothetical protein NT069_13510 [Planctomycetota bacterium]|nr:hypothetical protein [Planctomycetota bacterium]
MMVIGIRDLFPSELWSKTASVAVMVVLFFAFPTGVWSDQTTGEKSDRDHAVAIAKRRVEALIKREESRAEKEWRDARMALDREESAPSPFRGNYEKLDEPHKKLIQETLHDNLKQVSLVLEDEAKGVGAEGSQAIRADLQDKVVAGATELILARYKRRELDANRDFVGQLASIFNVDNWWLWLWGVVGVAALVGLIAYRGRHMLRRYVFVRKSRFWWAVAVLAFLIAMPAVPTILGWVL